MKFNTILLFALMVVILAGAPFVLHEDASLKVGDKTPALSAGNNRGELTLDQLKGHYVLLDFWTSSDAGSRLKSNEYNSLKATDCDGKLPLLVSVNFDKSKRLFDEIVKRDHLNADTQYHVGGKDAELIRDSFRLNGNYNSYLIGPEGRVVMVNPTPEYLQQRFG